MQPYSLGMLEDKLKAMYKSVTEGKFSEALRQVNVLLALIPLTIVDTRREVDELKELIAIARCAAIAPRRGVDVCKQRWMPSAIATAFVPAATHMW